MKRRIICLILASMLMVNFTACKKDKPSEPAYANKTDSSSSAETTTEAVSTEPLETPADNFSYKYDATLGGIIITHYSGTSINVIIPAKIEGEPVTGIEGAFKSKGVKEVYIPDSVKSIGDAFIGCTALTSITIPDSVTRITMNAFMGCTGLTSITYKGKVFSDENSFIGERSSHRSVMRGKKLTFITLGATRGSKLV